MEDGIVVKGHRTVIPHSLLAPYIDIMHRGPPGLELTKCRARMTVNNEQRHHREAAVMLGLQ